MAKSGLRVLLAALVAFAFGCGSREVDLTAGESPPSQEFINKQSSMMKGLGFDPAQSVAYIDRKNKLYHLATCEDAEGLGAEDRRPPGMVQFMGLKPCPKCIAAGSQQPAGQ